MDTQTHTKIRHKHIQNVNAHALVAVAPLVLYWMTMIIVFNIFETHEYVCVCLKLFFVVFFLKHNQIYIDQLDWNGKKNKIEILQTIYFVQVYVVRSNRIELIACCTWNELNCLAALKLAEVTQKKKVIRWNQQLSKKTKKNVKWKCV